MDEHLERKENLKNTKFDSYFNQKAQKIFFNAILCIFKKIVLVVLFFIVLCSEMS